MGFSHDLSLNVSQWNNITHHHQSETRSSRQSQHARLWQPHFGIDMGSCQLSLWSKCQHKYTRLLRYTLTKLRLAIYNKCLGLLMAGVLLLHDNARPHSAIRTQNLIRSFGQEQIDHPSYSLDLVPNDFHLIRYQKEFLSDKHFPTHDKVKEVVHVWLSSYAADGYDLGYRSLQNDMTNVQTNMETMYKNRDTRKELKKCSFLKNIVMFYIL